MPEIVTRRTTAPIIHAFPGMGDFSVSPLFSALDAEPLLHAALREVFKETDKVGGEFGIGPIGRRLLAKQVSTGELAREPAGTLQLALFGVCVAVHRTQSVLGRPADRILAVSFGEIPALVAAGSCTLADGARLACRLGQLLGRRSGGLLLVRSDEPGVRAMISRTDEVVVACVNDDTETVVSGPAEALAKVEIQARKAGHDTQRLRLPFMAHHPALGREAGEFAHFARGLRLTTVRLPFYSAVAKGAYTTATDLPRALSACVVRPASLPSVVTAATADKAVVIEIGTGSALTRNIRRIRPGLQAWAAIAERENNPPARRFPRPTTSPASPTLPL